MKSAILIVTLAIIALGGPLWTPTAQATTLTLSFGAPFGDTDPGKPNPDGIPPWLTAEFTDTTGGVQLDLTANLTGDNFIRLIYFNYIPQSSANVLTFAPTTGVTLGLNHVNADGDGYFDIGLNLDDLGALTATNTTQSFLITGPTDLDVSDFEYKSGAKGSDTDTYEREFGPYFAAAHVQSISTDPPGSTWIYAEIDDDGDIIEVVPEPSTVILLGSGLLGLLYAGRRRSRK